MQRIRIALALGLAALGGLWEPVRTGLRASAVAPPELDAGIQADRVYGSLRGKLPPRVGYCTDVDPSMLRFIAPADRNSDRLASRFLAQYALAPVVLVPVLGQPVNGQRDPPESERQARLAELGLVLVVAPVGSSCWNGALAAGFSPVSQSGPVILFARGTP